MPARNSRAEASDARPAFGFGYRERDQGPAAYPSDRSHRRRPGFFPGMSVGLQRQTDASSRPSRLGRLSNTLRTPAWRRHKTAALPAPIHIDSRPVAFALIP